MHSAHKDTGLAEARCEFRATLASGKTQCRSVLALIWMTQLAADIMNCRYVLPLLMIRGRTEVPWANNPAARMLLGKSLAELPGEGQDLFIVNHAEDLKALQADVASAFGDPVGFYLRIHVCQGPGYRFDLLLLDDKRRSTLDNRSLKLLHETVGVMKLEASEIMPLLTSQRTHTEHHLSRRDINALVPNASDAALLLNGALQVVAINPCMCELLAVTRTAARGADIRAVAAQFSPALELMCQRATLTSYASPMLEATIQRPDGSASTLGLLVQPVVDRASGQRFALVMAQDITELNRKQAAIAARVARRREAAGQNEPTINFLLDTLTVRPSIRLRNGISYLTLRTWRQSMRRYQLNAIKSFKRHNASELSEKVAEEIAKALNMLVGQGPFSTIVPMPCGHSREENCLSVQIAEALGRHLDIKVVHAFENQLLAGSSHPKANARRPKMKLVQEVTDATLLVDDIATSGAHIEEAVKLLRQHARAVLPVAWISGTSAT